MKKIFIGLSAIFAFAFGFTGCDTDYVTYSGPDYIMFSDTLTVLPVQNNEFAASFTYASPERVWSSQASARFRLVQQA